MQYAHSDTGPQRTRPHDLDQQALSLMARPAYNHTTGFDGTPVFEGLARILRQARRDGVEFRLMSADRRKGRAERYGKLSQVALYLGWLAGKAGFNPANPPGRSTHELRSDGVAYRGPVGRPLAWWQLGLDVYNAEALRRYLVRKGYKVKRPYTADSEAHHLNFTSNPASRWRALRRKAARILARKRRRRG